jgi:Bacterial archaeo-eukaryotic release factor family 3
MHAQLTPEIRELMEAVHYRPAVSIILPFEPKMTSKSAITLLLNKAADKVERELIENYPDEMGKIVMNKLRIIYNSLNFTTHKKSIAIYVSPVFEKVLYLGIEVEEKVIVDESFEIRDLVYSKKQIHKYLVLLLSGNGSKIYIGNTESFVKIVVDKFLHYVDNALGNILNAYQIPLFVLGTDKILGHFKKFTKHSSSIIDYVHGNYEELSPLELLKLLQPHVTDWRQVRQKEILNEIEKAASANKLAIGMRDVWREAMARKGKLLLVEKNYMYAAEHGSSEEIIYKAIEPYSKFSYIKDAVDDVIEKVLENDGDVEFVDEGVLKDFHHIALVKYY